MKKILLLILSAFLSISVLPADIEAGGQLSDSLDFNLELLESKVFGFSSEPVDSWADEPVEIENKTLMVHADSATPVYVYWKISSTDSFSLSLSGTAMTSDSGTIDWIAEWENQEGKTELGHSDDYASKTIASFESSGFKSQVGSEKVDISLESTDAVPGYYTGTITLEVNDNR